MKRILPIKPDQNYSTTCWDSNWLSIILSDDKYLPWYIEHFISIFMENNYLVKNYDTFNTEYSSIYNEVLEIIPLETFYGSVDDFVTFTKNYINNGYYVNFTLDLYFMEFSKFFNKSHEFHGPLVFGYDDEKKVFYGYDLWSGLAEYKYDQYRAGCESLFTSIRNKVVHNLSKEHENYDFNKKDFMRFNIGIHTMGHLTRIKNQSFREKPLLGSILLGIEECLEGNIILSEKNRDLNKWFGLSMYNKLNREVLSSCEQIIICNKEYNNIYRCFKAILENKKGLKYRISYLNNNQIIPIDYDLLNRFDTLIEELNKAYLLFIKFNQTHNKKYLDIVNNIMSNIENIDREVLERSSDAIFNVIKRDLNP